jgi:hypothetical protein
MAGIVAIYGLVVSVIMGANLVSSEENYTTFKSARAFEFIHLEFQGLRTIHGWTCVRHVRPVFWLRHWKCG